MRNFLKVAALFFFLFSVSSADAASRFWVGGTGTWDSTTTTHWATGSGLGGGASAPVNGDSVTFDANSGGGTVTPNGTISGLSITTFATGNFGGTLDFSANNPNLTISVIFDNNGSGTRTINLGSGTFTLSANNGIVVNFSTITGLTFNAGTSTLLLNGSPTQAASLRALVLGNGLTWATITITNGGSSGAYTDFSTSTGYTIGTLNFIAPVAIRFSSAAITITNAINWAGTTALNSLNIFGTSGSATPTITVASGSTIDWAFLSGVVFGGNAVTATNSFNLRGNNMNGGSITAPSGGGGGGGRIIGG